MSNESKSPADGKVNSYRKSTSTSSGPIDTATFTTSTEPGPDVQSSVSSVQDNLEVTVGNALKLTSWESVKNYPFKPCVVSSISAGLLAASAISCGMLIKRRPFSSCANSFVFTSTIVSGGAYGICQVQLRDKKMKVIEIQQEIRRKHEDEVLKERLDARLRLREDERAQKREDWLSGLAPNMASDPPPAHPSVEKQE